MEGGVLVTMILIGCEAGDTEPPSLNKTKPLSEDWGFLIQAVFLLSIGRSGERDGVRPLSREMRSITSIHFLGSETPKIDLRVEPISSQLMLAKSACRFLCRTTLMVSRFRGELLPPFTLLVRWCTLVP